MSLDECMTPTARGPRASAALKRFARETSGSVVVESVLILPLLVWAYVATFVYFDAFRTQNVNLKAAYTLADMLSRRTDMVDAAYVDGLNRVYDYLSHARGTTALRVTSICHDTKKAGYVVGWSYATKGAAPMTDAALGGFSAQLPQMPTDESVIVVESTLDYQPLFNVGIGRTTFSQFIATRPRFAPQVLFAGKPSACAI